MDWLTSVDIKVGVLGGGAEGSVLEAEAEAEAEAVEAALF